MDRCSLPAMSGSHGTEAWNSGEVVFFLAGFAVAVTLGTVLPVPWWLRLVAIAVLTTGFIVLVSRFRPGIERLVRFLTSMPARGAAANADVVGMTDAVYGTLVKAGADGADPSAARVLLEDLDGNVHVAEVHPPATDIEAAMRDVVPRLRVPVLSLRAMHGYAEVARWTPSWWERLKLTWILSR